MLRLRALPHSTFAWALAALSLTLAAGSLPAAAQANGWTLVGGPGGGTVTDVVVSPGSPGRVWAATVTGGLFHSPDAAASWKPATGRVIGHEGSGLDLDPSWAQGEILAIGADPSSPGTLYASTRQTLLKTTDHGVTWRPTGLSGDITSVVVAPSSSQVVYISNNSLIWRSDNGGETWRRLRPDLEIGFIYSLTVDPRDPQVLYVSSSEGIFRSLDGGGEWYEAPGFDFVEITAVAVDPQRPSTVYASARFGGIWKSLDQGTTWSPIGNLGSESQVHGLVVHPSQPDTLYAGVNRFVERSPNGNQLFSGQVLRSTDGGATWVSLFSTDAIETLAIDPGNPFRLYLGAERSGVWKTEDGGATWVRASEGLTATLVNRLTSDPYHPGVLYAAVASYRNDIFEQVSLGVWKSEDGGATWRPINTGLESGSDRFLPLVRDLVADPETPGVLYASSLQGLFKTTDGGATWQPADDGSPVRSVYGFALDPTDPDILYAVGTADPTQRPPAAAKSTDGGATWSPLPGIGTFVQTVAVDPDNPETVFTGGAFLRSDDAGQTWREVSPRNAQRLLILPGTPQILYAIDSFQLVGSANGGQTFTQVSLSSPDLQTSVYDLQTSPQDPSILYVATSQGIFVLRKPDNTWAPVTESLEPRWFLSVAADAFEPQRVYAASRGGLIYTHSPVSSECLDTSTTLCLGGRFAVSVTQENPDGPLQGQARPATSRSGSFWVFDPDNAEVVVKVLDGRPVNGSFWVFFATLSNLRYSVRVTDTTTGSFRLYQTENGKAASRADTDAFRDDTTDPLPDRFATGALTPPPPTCTGAPAALCLGERRFRVQVTWRNSGTTGAGQAEPLGENSGAFWLSGPQDLDAAVKILDGRTVNGHFWVFYASLTTLPYTMTVTDMETGAVKTYDKPAGELSSRIDIAAF